MGNEKYINYYIEILSATLNDTVLRNISLQANAKVTEGIIGEQEQTIQRLQSIVEQNEQNGNQTVVDLEKTIKELRDDLANVNKLRGEYESVKSQAQHVDTFRNELLKARKETEDVRAEYEARISELNDKIEYLQLTPAKRKKVDEAKAVALGSESPSVLPLVDETTKDGGSF
jgi:chromosome segregation ATPase